MTINNENLSTTAKASGLSDLDNAVSNPPAWLTEALSVPREEGTVNVNDCEIHYFRWGDPANPPLVLMHGFLAHSRCFAFVAPYLANDYHIVAYDHSGMGDSEWRDDYSEDVRVAELLGVCEQTGLFEHAEKPTIIAHSYGGRIATAAVHANPETFAGLVICDLMIIRPSFLKAHADKFSPPGGGRDPEKPNRVYPDYDTAKKRFVLAPPQPVEVEELKDFMAYHSLKEVEGGWQWKFDPRVFRRTAKAENSWMTIGENVVTAPGRKAIIYGKDSILFNDDSVKYVNGLIEEHKQESIPIIGIPYARHHLMLDQPIAFISALKTVLSLWK